MKSAPIRFSVGPCASVESRAGIVRRTSRFMPAWRSEDLLRSSASPGSWQLRQSFSRRLTPFGSARLGAARIGPARLSSAGRAALSAGCVAVLPWLAGGSCAAGGRQVSLRRRPTVVTAPHRVIEYRRQPDLHLRNASVPAAAAARCPARRFAQLGAEHRRPSRRAASFTTRAAVTSRPTSERTPARAPRAAGPPAPLVGQRARAPLPGTARWQAVGRPATSRLAQKGDTSR